MSATATRPTLIRTSVERLVDPDTDVRQVLSSNNYRGLPAAERAEYERQDAARIAAYDRGEWSYIGVCAVAEISIPLGPGGGVLQRITTPGIWAVEDDSDADHLAMLENEERETLQIMLRLLNVEGA